MPCHGNAYCYLCNVILMTSHKRQEPEYLWLNECIAYDKLNETCYHATAGEDLMHRVYIKLNLLELEEEHYYKDKKTHKQVKYMPTDKKDKEGKYVTSDDKYVLLHKLCFRVYKKYNDKYNEIISPMLNLPDVDEQDGFNSHLETHKDILFVYGDPRIDPNNKSRFIKHVEEVKKKLRRI